MVQENKKNILFICSSLNYGGAQKVIANISNTLPNDYEVDFLLNSADDIQFDYRGNIFSLGLYEPKNRDSLLYQMIVFIRRYKMLRRKKRKRITPLLSVFLQVQM